MADAHRVMNKWKCIAVMGVGACVGGWGDYGHETLLILGEVTPNTQQYPLNFDPDTIEISYKLLPALSWDNLT